MNASMGLFDKFRIKKRREVEIDDALSPEADRFLAEACAEFEHKQAVLDRDWRFDSAQEWGFDQNTGVLWLTFSDGSRLEANAQILGSYSAEDQSWQWAWSNRNADDAMALDSRKVKELGERLGIAYLQEDVIPLPNETSVSYLDSVPVAG